MGSFNLYLYPFGYFIVIFSHSKCSKEAAVPVEKKNAQKVGINVDDKEVEVDALFAF
jgi:hypothetical protein